MISERLACAEISFRSAGQWSRLCWHAGLAIRLPLWRGELFLFLKSGPFVYGGDIYLFIFIFHARSRREGIDQDAVNGHELPMAMSYLAELNMRKKNDGKLRIKTICIVNVLHYLLGKRKVKCKHVMKWIGVRLVHPILR